MLFLTEEEHEVMNVLSLKSVWAGVRDVLWQKRQRFCLPALPLLVKLVIHDVLPIVVCVTRKLHKLF